MTVHRPPSGARDLLPLDVVQKRWIELRLQRAFESWSYHRIATSTLERLDTLMAGGAVDRATVIQFQDTDDELLGLRPELTASIARAAVTRMDLEGGPERLFYNANVFRRHPQGARGQQHEFYQSGVELLGSAGVAADAEILLVLADSLQALGVPHPRLLLGEAGLTRSLLEPFPAEIRPGVRRALACLDRVALSNLPAPLRDRALFLFELRGRPADVLSKLAALDLNPEQRRALENLKSLVDLLAEYARADAGSPLLQEVVLDLSSIQSFDYYTGIVFKAIAQTETGLQRLGQGGRYDNLLALYHPQGKSYPGIGFVLDMETLHRVLLPTGQLPEDTPASHWLVVPTDGRARSAAFARAKVLREERARVRVEMELAEASDPETVRATARDRGIPQIAWVNAEGKVEIETVEIETVEAQA